MTKIIPFCNIYNRLDFEAATCGHRVYQSKLTPALNLKLKYAID